MKMKNKLFIILINFILLSAIFIQKSNQKQQSTKIVQDEISDDMLDPQDIAEYELEKIKNENSKKTSNLDPISDEEYSEDSTEDEITTTSANDKVDNIKTSLNQEETTIKTETDKTSTEVIDAQTETSSESTKSSPEDSEESDEETTHHTILTTTLESLTPKPKKKNDKQLPNIFDFEVSSVEYKEILVEKLDDKSDTISYYSFKASKKFYQIMLLIDVQNKHLDFSKCAISLNDSSHECLLSYIEILNSKFVLKIKRNLLPSEIRLKVRLVISGCDSINRIKDLDLADNLPAIYHNSDHDCIYRISNNDMNRYMMSLKINSFPVHEDRICHASMEISNSNSLSKEDFYTQAKFETHDSIIPFQENGIQIGSKYALIKMINCFENNEPIEIKIEQVKRSFKDVIMSENENKYFHRLDSSPLISPKLDSNFLFEIINEDPRNIILVKLTEFRTRVAKDLCESAEKNSSVITVYGQNQFNEIYLNQYTSCDFNLNSNELRGFKKVYIQFNREPFHPSLNRNPDNFIMEFNLKVVKKIYKVLRNKVGYFSSDIELQGSDMRNLNLDFEIESKLGHRVVLNMTKFSSGRKLTASNSSCLDYAIVKLNRTTNRIDSLIERNPIICDSIENFQVHSSFSNRLFLTFIFNEISEDQNEERLKPIIEFSYHFEPICDNTFTRSSKKLISYSSLESVLSNDLHENIDCLNVIRLKPKRRVVLYKINWLTNQNSLISNEEEINTNYVNGPQICKSSDSLLISNENPKYVTINQNQYCMDNQFYSYISDSNMVYLNFKRSTDPTHLVKPLVFDLGYFSYKYLYNDNDNFIDVDFSQIIPDNVNNRTKIDLLQFKIKLSDSNNYIYPIISDCFTEIKNGLVNIRSNQRSVPFKMSCGQQTFTLMSSMSNELSIEFINVNLRELRNNSIRFKLNYTTLPRVFTSLTGKFETNKFEHNYINPSREIVEYDFMINLDPRYMIKLNIEELKNDFGINEFSIIDANTNENLYERNELIENYKLEKKFSYLFSSNRIKIVFKHNKEINVKLSKYPYLRCSYSAEPKVIDSNHLSGELSLNNTMTKNILDWFIVAPIEHVIVVKITKFSATEDRGQLKFSLLNTGYSDNGIYHFNLNSKNLPNLHERNTDIVVSKDHMIKIEYSSGGLNDIFKLEYSMVRNVFTQPCGIIKQYYNNLTQPIINVPKLTDQSWIIRAPYSKRIQLFTKFIDLLNESPCSKASINFYESNSNLIDSKCGHLDFKQTNLDLETTQALVSQSNELQIRFMTQNTNDVVYLNEPPQLQLYQGFTYYYSYLETPGDCYFQNKKNQMCNYTNHGDSKWLVKGEPVKSNKDDSDFDKYFCSSCYLNAQVSIQTENGDDSSAILVSPVIHKSKRFIKFWYKLKNSARLTLKFLYDKEFVNKTIDKASVLKVFNESNSEWKLAKVRIGLQMFYNYHIIFELDKHDQSESLQPEASLDNIELFEQDFDCLDSSCLIEDDSKLMNKSSINKNYLNDLLHTRDSCQKYLTPCDFNKCKNGAICVNHDEFFNHLIDSKQSNLNDNEYECVCPLGFTGKFCEKQLDPCSIPDFHKCSSHSKCKPLNKFPMEYTCECDPQYHGKFCDIKYEPCKKLDNPCNQLTGQGICNDFGSVHNPNNYTCTCSPMYSGPECELVIQDRCLNSECNKHDPKAICIELEDRFVCKCSPGFEGPSCLSIDDCASNPCQNKGKCIDGINSFKCECGDNFEGKYCEKSKACSSCDQQGTLFCDSENPKCVCKETHDGELCDIVLDQCQAKPCINGDCISDKLGGDYQCICQFGFKGKNCDKKEDLCDQGFCQNGATCVLEMEEETGKIGYSCQCPDGFEGKNCELQIDLCHVNNCKNGATCISSVNSFTCVCPIGYTGVNCEVKIDNCQNSKCSHGSTCVSVLNSYICKCAPGFFGRYCDEEVDKCLKNECQNGKCIPNELDNNYRCNCMPGFTGRYCEINIDDCESNPCQNKAQCVDLLNSYKCICPQNYTGKNCEYTFEYCSLPETRCNPASTRRCIPIPGGNKCECLPRYTGLKCEIQIDVCEYYKPCRSGKCKLLGTNDYICENCDSGFMGKNCSEMIDYCTPINPCQNGGSCLNEAKGYFCKCKDGYRGKNCQERISLPCLYNKCKHNSECVPTDKGYRCECDEKHEGTYCELKKKDLCKDLPCDGYCVNGKCECDPRIIFCKKQSECHNIKCENGGTCLDVIRGEKTVGICLCPPGMVGNYCEQSMYCNMTNTLPCRTTGQCSTVNQTYECNCEKPFIGHGCSKRVADYLPNYENFLRQEKLMNEKVNCKFGKSKESKLLIGIICIAALIMLIVGFLMGHMSILKYKKRFERSKLDKTDTNFTFDETINYGLQQKTPLMKKNSTAQEITLNKSAGAFSIPRPSVRL